MESALPYRIPGPAGGISTQQQTPNATPQKPLLDLFRTTPWRQMLAYLNRKIPSSIALLRRNALSNDFAKLTTLPVLIDSLAYVGKDASVLLRDPTGHVRGTIHAEVFQQRKGMLERGVVILLDGVSALAYLEESRGFRRRDDAVHLSVQACHVSEVFKGRPALAPAPSSRSLLDDYESHAKSPKPVVRPPTKRLPLRDRNYSQPISSGYQSRPRGGTTGRGRDQHSSSPPQSRPPSQYRMHQHHPRYRHQQFQRQHSPNQPPPYQNMTHQRPMLGSNQHKRPFRPPGMRSNTMERGMPPPQKRPNVRQFQQPYRQPPQQSNTVAAITDEQLDTLLGDLDVDAVIAAHSKSASLHEQSAPSDAQNEPVAKEIPTSASKTTSEPQEGRLGVSPCKIPTDSTDSSGAKSYASRDSPGVHVPATGEPANDDGAHAHAHDTNPVIVSGPQLSEQLTDSIAERVQTSLLQHSDNLTLSNVNQDIVDNLFEGIDTAEFM